MHTRSIMPVVHKVFGNLTVPNDPSDAVLNTYVDLSMLLSEKYSKQVRQGNTFKVKAVQAAIIPSAGLTDDWDTGSSVTVKHEFVQTSKLTRQAWNKIFNVWKKQQRSSASHTPVKYNDFEVGYTRTTSYLNEDRTSTIYSKGMGDTTPEMVCMYGSSTDNSDFTLQDYVNSMMDAPAPSVDPFDSTIIKAPKFDHGNRWPDASRIYIPANASVMYDDGDASGAAVSMPIQEFPEALNVMCGLLKTNVYIPMDDTLGQYADTFDLILSYHITKWTPLVIRPKRKAPVKRSSRRRSRRGRRSVKTYRFG